MFAECTGKASVFGKLHVRLQILLLITFTYWASGFAQYFHERIEHRHDVAPQTTFHPAGTRHLPAEVPNPAPEPDHRDDCATCQSLKIMKAAPVAPPVVAPQLTLLEHASPPTLHREPPTLSFVLFLPARAPPALPPLASA